MNKVKGEAYYKTAVLQKTINVDMYKVADSNVVLGVWYDFNVRIIAEVQQALQETYAKSIVTTRNNLTCTPRI